MPVTGRSALLFDLDGTLVDSAPDMADAVDRMLQDLGRPPVGEAQVRCWVGNGARRLVTRALTGKLDGEANGHLVDQAHAAFIGHYRAGLCVRSRLYPGVRQGLDALREAGHAMACVTNKPEPLARDLLAALGLDEVLPVVVGGDTTPARKPDPRPLRHALARLGATVDQALMVGDSRTDIAAARNAGVPVVCVPYGYNHGEDIRQAGADAVVDDIMTLHRRLTEAA